MGAQDVWLSGEALGFQQYSNDSGLYYSQDGEGLVVMHANDLLCVFWMMEDM